MRPNISEFSYGYALTEELVHWHGRLMTLSSRFSCSLYQRKTRRWLGRQAKETWHTAFPAVQTVRLHEPKKRL